MSAAVLTPAGIDQPLSAIDASRLFGVTPATIRKWAQLGHITAIDIGAAGQKLYRLIDIARYERSTRTRAGRN